MSAAPGTTKPTRSFALKQKSPSFHHADLDAPAEDGDCANWEHRERGRGVSGRDGVTSAVARGDGRGRRKDCMGGVRNGKEAEEKEGLSEAEHLGERASTRQSRRDSGMVSQARLKNKWKISLSRINTILVN